MNDSGIVLASAEGRRKQMSHEAEEIEAQLCWMLYGTPTCRKNNLQFKAIVWKSY